MAAQAGDLLRDRADLSVAEIARQHLVIATHPRLSGHFLQKSAKRLPHGVGPDVNSVRGRSSHSGI